jgi:hypothetical protein
MDFNRIISVAVRNHPFSQECQAFRPVRVTPPPATPGRMGVLSSDDEDTVEYSHLGNGYMLPADEFQPGQVSDSGIAELDGLAPRVYLITPAGQTGSPEWFDVRKNDVVYCVITDTVKIAWEVVAIDTVTDNPVGMAVRYICNRRADLDLI